MMAAEIIQDNRDFDMFRHMKSPCKICRHEQLTKHHQEKMSVLRQGVRSQNMSSLWN